MQRLSTSQHSAEIPANVSRTTSRTNLIPASADLRVKWMFEFIQTSFPNIPEQLIRIYTRDHGVQIKKYLDETLVFKSLFFINIYNEAEDVYKRGFLRRKQLRQKRRDAKVMPLNHSLRGRGRIFKLLGGSPPLPMYICLRSDFVFGKHSRHHSRQ